MLRNLFTQTQSPEEFIEILKHLHEKYIIELKEASNLPSSFWETYSSFSNTSGGMVVLGVNEQEPENKIIGVGNANKILNDLWNGLHNPNKVSFQNISNEDVITLKVEDNRSIIIINIPEAPDSMKPVYLNGKENVVYIRTGDGDRKATTEEINAMIGMPIQHKIPLH